MFCSTSDSRDSSVMRSHRVPECCECDATDCLVEHDDGDHYCPTHILTVRSTP